MRGKSDNSGRKSPPTSTNRGKGRASKASNDAAHAADAPIESAELGLPPLPPTFGTDFFSRSKVFLSTLIGNFPNGTVAVLDADLRYLFIEGQGLNLLGLSSEALLKKSIFDVLPPDTAQILAPQYRRALAGEQVSFEAAIFGKVFQVRAALLPGSTHAILSVSQDITRRKQAEAALRENENRLSSIIGGLKEIVWSFSATSFDLLYANPAFEAAFERPAADFFQNPQIWDDVIHPDDQQKVAEWMADVMSYGTAECIARIFRPSGEVRWLHERATRSSDAAAGETQRIDVVATDVTESRLAQQEHEQLAAIVEFTDDAIISKNLEGIILSWNTGAEKMYGYRADEVVGKSLGLLIPPESTGDLEWILYSIRAGRPIVQYEMTRMRKDGRRIVVSHTISPMRNADGTLVGASTISRDITQMKVAQTALRESEEKFRTLANNLPDIITRFDLDGRHLYINRAIETVTQKSVTDYLGRTNAEMDMPAPLVTLWGNSALQARKTGRQQKIPFDFETPYGTRHFDGSLVPEFGPDGTTVVSLLGVTRDVTEAKNAEAELCRQKGLLESQSEASIDGILTVSMDHTIIGYNRRFVELWNLDESLLKSETDALTLQYLAERLVDTRQFLARVEYLSTHPDEESNRVAALKDGRFFELRTAPAKGADGTLYGRILFFRDVTEREEMEATLRASEERFRALTEHSSDMITVLDPDGTVRYNSPSVTAILGYLPDELNGIRTLALVHPDDVPMAAETLRSLGAGDAVLTLPLYRYRHKDGSWRWLESNGSNQISNPAIGGFVVNSRDVTERVELQRQLIQNEKLAVFGELVAGVAHEIANPLTAISGYAQLLLNHADETVREDAAVIESMVQRSTRILRSLRSYARPSGGEARTTGYLNDVVASALDVVAYRMRRAEVTVVLNLSDDLPPVRMNAGELEQVVVNLLANAEHALRGRPADKKTIRLTTRAAHRETNNKGGSQNEKGRNDNIVCLLEVEDTGVGMGESVRERIFDPFFSTKKTKEGTGLGLYISHGIVTAHGGTIEVRSREGIGTTFTIILPADPTPEADAETSPVPGSEEGHY